MYESNFSILFQLSQQLLETLNMKAPYKRFNILRTTHDTKKQLKKMHSFWKNLNLDVD